MIEPIVEDNLLLVSYILPENKAMKYVLNRSEYVFNIHMIVWYKKEYTFEINRSIVTQIFSEHML